jgi:hypothetical protein
VGGGGLSGLGRRSPVTASEPLAAGACQPPQCFTAGHGGRLGACEKECDSHSVGKDGDWHGDEDAKRTLALQVRFEGWLLQ